MPFKAANDLHLLQSEAEPFIKTGLERLIRTLSTVGSLTKADQSEIRALPGKISKLKSREDVATQGERSNSLAVIVDGFACRYNLLPSGKRQIVSFHMAGDALNVQSLYVDIMDHSVGTLEKSTILHIPQDAVLRLFERSPRTASLFWRWTLLDASVFREWVVNIGQRDAYKRTAHVLCEVVTRMNSVGLAEGSTYQFPLTQSDLGDTTGLSSVHVNRKLQALRSNGLIRLKSGELTVLDWDGLKEAAEFDPTYLHLPTGAA